jgi:hypothetical protein
MRLFQLASRKFSLDAPHRKRQEMISFRSLAAMLRQVITAVTVVILGSALANAQFDTGTITGLVTDPTGAAVAHASITIINVGTSFKKSLRTDGGGNFTASALPSGS